MVQNCTVCLNSTRRNTNLSFFGYPKERDRRNQWLKVVGREDLITKLEDEKKRPNYRICEEHFERTCFVVSKNGYIKFLSSVAFPTLNLPVIVDADASQCQSEPEHQHPIIQNVLYTATVPVCSDITENNVIIVADVTPRSVQADIPNKEIIESGSRQPLTLPCISPDNPRKRKLDEQVQDTQVADLDLNRITKEDFLQLCDIFLHKSMAQLTKWQIHFQAASRGNRHSDAFKFFALDLHYSGPAAHTFLRNTISLPTLATLRNLVTPLGTRIDERILTALKIKVDRMLPQEKICSVSVDCMYLKENLYYDIRNDRIIGFHEINGKQKHLIARYVIVIMIRGIIYRWKQPVAHSFLAQCNNYGDVSNWIDEIITTLMEIGLDVRAFISDLGSDFLSASKSRAVNVDKPYFEVNGRKIYYVFDVLYLMKCVRNNLKTYNFIYDGDKVAKWSDIRDMYNKDKSNKLRLAPKLTNIHINPNNILKMRGKLAVQVLSHTVSTAIKTYVDLKLMDPLAIETAEFVDRINNLFDMLNSSTLQSTNKFKLAYCGDEFQIEILREMIDFFKKLKLVKAGTEVDVTNTVDFIRGFQISIKSIIKLYDDLQSIGVKSIQTRRINQDALEHLFGKVRQVGRGCREPTCRQFENTYKKLFVCNILKTPVGSKCEEDLESLIMKHENCQPFYETLQLSNPQEVNNEIGTTTIAVGTSDYKFELPSNNTVFYVSVYLYKKCLEKHKCEKIRSYIKRSEQSIQMPDDYSFSHYKDYDEGNEQAVFLIIPPNNFVAFIGILEDTYCQYFDFKQNNSKNIGNGILKYIEHCTFEMPCDCFPMDYLKKLFIRLRIYQTVKLNNKNFTNHRVKMFRVSHL